ncbi:MAG: cysteine methyltransferase [Pelagibacteraceae bacterium]|nr:cysteine methyltransferase [Pelagibacteraceae bacterium]
MIIKYFYEDITTPIGNIFILENKYGICCVSMSRDKRIVKIKNEFNPKVGLKFYKTIKKNLIRYLNGKERLKPPPVLFLSGTNFQKKVWKQLLRIKHGTTSNYSMIANNIKLPNAQRAVGTAIAKNPILFYLPCHRVVKKNGNIGKYIWGMSIKKKLLNMEMADPI